MFITGETVGLAEWIIDDTFLVPIFFAHHFFSLSLQARIYPDIRKSSN